MEPDPTATILELQARISELEEAGTRDASALRFLDAMDRIHRISVDNQELQGFLRAVLDAMLELLDCDRAWLLYPCDPGAPSWKVTMERTREDWTGAYASGDEVPMDPLVASIFEEALSSPDPLPFDATTERSVPPEIAEAFQIRSQIVLAVRPRTDRGWLLGIHHCSEARVYGPDDLRLFAGIGDRVGEALDTLLTLRTLEESEGRYRALVEHAPESILVVDGGGRLLDANRRAVELFGRDRPALLRTSLSELGPEPAAGEAPFSEAINEALHGAGEGMSRVVRWTLVGAQDRHLEAEVRLLRLPGSGPERIRLSIVDVTERQALQRQVQHLQQMKAIGELASGLAHDFNNHLLVMLYHAEVLKRHLGDRPDVAAHADRIVSAAEGSAELTRQFLAFSRRAVLQPQVVSFDEVLGSLAGLLERLLGSGTTLELDLDLDPSGVLARVDIQQLEQVLVNLVANARDALPEGGHVLVQTSRTVLSDGPQLRELGLVPGPYACCRITDDGTGMDAETLQKIFEPFYTTKERGKGTGLGLSTALGVVEQSGGTIRVSSQLGLGTTFSIYLPAAEEVAVPAVAAAAAATFAFAQETGAVILLVEDHEEVAEVADEALTASGYQVLWRSDGPAALQVLASDTPIDLLFTDLGLPGLSGEELSERAEALRPGLPVLFTSGHGEGRRGVPGSEAGGTAFLQKPYTLAELIARVEQAIA